ncbi:unnamed protein product [Pocillopora meandrina]|uniref:G-protein coupled receptors family 1 profile domain-containing protein n=1 Tax=Pocillopora meandrina TaxID=46732 RepID=A0AAU9WLN3_9CNID|nr:unnamed protein product [Pocillopora meandrina]
MSNLELPSRSLLVFITEASVCIALSITSIIGNSLVCVATYRNSNLRSTTNLYIIALAVFGDALCQFQGSVTEFTYYFTPATLGLTAFNRYVKIEKTSHYKMFSSQRSKIWLNWLRIEFMQSYAVCVFAFPTSESQIVHYCTTFGLLFVLPLFVGIFSYYKIFLKTNEHQHSVVSSLQNGSENCSVTN